MMEITLDDKFQNKQQLTTKQILLVSFGFLICAAFLYPSLGFPTLGMVAGIPIIFSASYYIFKKYDRFSFILIIFFCSHFTFYDHFWILFFVIFLILFDFKGVLYRLTRPNRFLLLFKLIFIFNLIGLISNETAKGMDILAGIGVFLGYLFLFSFLISYPFKSVDFRRLFQMVLFISFFQLFLAVCQKTNLFGISLPFLPLQLVLLEGLSSSSEMRIIGTLGDFELLAEYSAFLLVGLMCFAFYRDVNRFINRNILLAACFSLALIIILTGTRSSIIVVGIAFLALMIYHIRVVFKPRFYIGAFVLLLATGIAWSSGDKIGLGLVFERLKETEIANSSNSSSDELINRNISFAYAYNRLDERSWIIGEGYVRGDSYKKALFGNVDAVVGNYHSLYLSIPIFFGWIGSFFFCLLIFASLVTYGKSIFSFRKSLIGFYISLALFMSWFLLFVNEYKVECLRFSNYFFLIWFWMAFSLNLVKRITIKNENYHVG